MALTRARIYPRDFVFFAVTSVTALPQCRKTNRKDGETRNKIPLICCHTENDLLSHGEKSGFTAVFVLNTVLQGFNPLKNIVLGRICDRCDSKKHKTLGYTRVRARVREGMNDGICNL